MPETQPLLRIEGLRTTFRTQDDTVHAVRGIDLTILPGRTLGLVGESGSGKSVTSLSILRLLPDRVATIDGGSIRFLGRVVGRVGSQALITVRESGEVRGLVTEPGRGWVITSDGAGRFAAPIRRPSWSSRSRRLTAVAAAS